MATAETLRIVVGICLSMLLSISVLLVVIFFLYKYVCPTNKVKDEDIKVDPDTIEVKPKERPDMFENDTSKNSVCKLTITPSDFTHHGRVILETWGAGDIRIESAKQETPENSPSKAKHISIKDKKGMSELEWSRNGVEQKGQRKTTSLKQSRETQFYRVVSDRFKKQLYVKLKHDCIVISDASKEQHQEKEQAVFAEDDDEDNLHIGKVWTTRIRTQKMNIRSEIGASHPHLLFRMVLFNGTLGQPMKIRRVFECSYTFDLCIGYPRPPNFHGIGAEGDHLGSNEVIRSVTWTMHLLKIWGFPPEPVLDDSSDYPSSVSANFSPPDTKYAVDTDDNNMEIELPQSLAKPTSAPEPTKDDYYYQIVLGPITNQYVSVYHMEKSMRGSRWKKVVQIEPTAVKNKTIVLREKEHYYLTLSHIYRRNFYNRHALLFGISRGNFILKRAISYVSSLYVNIRRNPQLSHVDDVMNHDMPPLAQLSKMQLAWEKAEDDQKNKEYDLDTHNKSANAAPIDPFAPNQHSFDGVIGSRLRIPLKDLHGYSVMKFCATFSPLCINEYMRGQRFNFDRHVCLESPIWLLSD